MHHANTLYSSAHIQNFDTNRYKTKVYIHKYAHLAFRYYSRL